MILVVGDTPEYLAKYSQSLDENSYLVNSENWNKEHSGTVYTSLGDVGKNILVSLIDQAEKVIYYPPAQWTSESTQQETEKVLFELSPYVPIENSELMKDYSHTAFLPVDSRKTDKPQLWCAGCSFTFGSGLKAEERWATLVSEELDIDHSLLARPGSSVSWSADQILRSDIRKDDIVVWGITTSNRFPWYSDKATTHVNIRAWSRSEELKNLINIDYFDSSHHTLNTKRLLLQVENFCEKVGAKLLLVNFLSDVDFLFLRKCQVLDLKKAEDESYPDMADDEHPGPKTNQIFAQKISKVLTKLV